MSIYQYRRNDELFELIDTGNGEVLATGQEIAIAFDIATFTLLKHGTKDRVDLWFQKTREKYLANGFSDILADIVVISSDKWDPEELNNILEISGYIRKFLVDRGYREQPAKQIGAKTANPEHNLAVVKKQLPLGSLCCHGRKGNGKKQGKKKRQRNRRKEIS